MAYTSNELTFINYVISYNKFIENNVKSTTFVIGIFVQKTINGGLIITVK